MHVEMELCLRRNPALYGGRGTKSSDNVPRTRGADEHLGTSCLWGVSMRTNPCVKSPVVLMPGGIDTEVKSLEGGAPATEMHELQQDEQLATCRA